MRYETKRDRWKRPPKPEKQKSETADVGVALLSYLFHQLKGHNGSTIYFTPKQVLGQLATANNMIALGSLLDEYENKIYGNQYQITVWKTYNRTQKMYCAVDITRWK